MYQTLKGFVDSIANWLEALGFIISIVTAVKVIAVNRRIKNFNKKHLFQIRSSEHIKKLKDIASKISSHISDFENKKIELLEQIKKTEEISKSIKKKVIRKDASELKKIISESKKIHRLPTDKSNLSFFKKTYFNLLNKDELNENIVSQFYIKLTGLITYLEELKKDNEKSLL